MGNETSKYLKRVETLLEENKEGYPQIERDSWAKLFKKYDEYDSNFLFDDNLERFLGDVFDSWTKSTEEENTNRFEIVRAFKKLLDKNGDGQVSLQEFMDAMHEVYYKYHIEKKSLSEIETEHSENLTSRRNILTEFDEQIADSLKAPVYDILANSKWTGSLIQNDGRNIYYQLVIKAADGGKLYGSHIISDFRERIVGAVKLDRANVLFEYRTHADDTVGDGEYILMRGKWALNGERRIRGTHVQVAKKQVEKGSDAVESFSGEKMLQDTENAATKGTFSVDFSEKMRSEAVEVYDEIDDGIEEQPQSNSVKPFCSDPVEGDLDVEEL
jgi:Ca2+-binding EF-hand superfamily protein